MSWTDAVAADLSTVGRARALAAATPGVGYIEVTFDMPFAEAWPLIADLERSVPAADPLVARLAVHDRRPVGDGTDELRFTTWSPLGWRLRFTARMEQGWCLMQARGRAFAVLMAAAPEPGDPERTRFCQFEGVPRRVAAPLRPLFRRTVRGDAAGFRRYLADRRGGG